MKPESDTAAMRAPNRFSTSRSTGGRSTALRLGTTANAFTVTCRTLCRLHTPQQCLHQEGRAGLLSASQESMLLWPRAALKAFTAHLHTICRFGASIGMHDSDCSPLHLVRDVRKSRQLGMTDKAFKVTCHAAGMRGKGRLPEQDEHPALGVGSERRPVGISEGVTWAYDQAK